MTPICPLDRLPCAGRPSPCEGCHAVSQEDTNVARLKTRDGVTERIRLPPAQILRALVGEIEIAGADVENLVVVCVKDGQLYVAGSEGAPTSLWMLGKAAQILLMSPTLDG